MIYHVIFVQHVLFISVTRSEIKPEWASVHMDFDCGMMRLYPLDRRWTRRFDAANSLLSTSPLRSYATCSLYQLSTRVPYIPYFYTKFLRLSKSVSLRITDCVLVCLPSRIIHRPLALSYNTHLTPTIRLSVFYTNNRYLIRRVFTRPRSHPYTREMSSVWSYTLRSCEHFSLFVPPSDFLPRSPFVPCRRLLLPLGTSQTPSFPPYPRDDCHIPLRFTPFKIEDLHVPLLFDHQVRSKTRMWSHHQLLYLYLSFRSSSPSWSCETDFFLSDYGNDRPRLTMTFLSRALISRPLVIFFLAFTFLPKASRDRRTRPSIRVQTIILIRNQVLCSLLYQSHSTKPAPETLTELF